MTNNSDRPLLEVREVEKYFGQQSRSRGAGQGRLTALDKISVHLRPNEVLGLVGESGSGKSTLARAIVQLDPPDAGEVIFDGQDITRLRGSGLKRVRKDIQLIYQDPYSSLNSRMTVRRALAEPALVHGLTTTAGVADFVAALLDKVRLPMSIAESHPRVLSGGQRQRVAIARALALQPRVLIADEAVSALDVSVQAQILNLFAELIEDLGLSMIFISHQLSVISQLADRVAILYLGKIVETGPTRDVFTHPRHPYTKVLLDAHPVISTVPATPTRLAGEVPSPYEIPPGCRFHPRCLFAQPSCRTIVPALTEVGPGHLAACHVLPSFEPRDAIVRR